MPLLSTHQLSYELNDGRTLFNNLTISLTHKRTAIVGQNGSGKSLLAALLYGNITPTQGHITRTSNIGYFAQLPNECSPSTSITVGDFLEISDVLEALDKLASGHCESVLFEIIGDNWNAHNDVTEKLRTIGLPLNPALTVSKLSGGEYTKLQLLKLFEQHPGLLILDEPSNHLDEEGKHWLLDKIKQFEGAILLVSHDRVLLNEMEEIWEIEDQTLHLYGGNYNAYKKQKTAQHEAFRRQLSALQQQTKHLEKQAQHNYEKAQQRASTGNRLRKNGSQAKVLLDKKRDNATKAASARNKNERARAAHITQHKQQLLQTASHKPLVDKPLRFYLKDQLNHKSHAKNKTAFSLENVILAYGTQQPLSLSINTHQKLQVSGKNGCGKSTLLKTLHKSLHAQAGRLSINTSTAYLDQHFSLLHNKATALENLMTQCPTLLLSEARTLMASAGLHGDTAMQSVATLSGGQKMKLAMLIVSNQRQQPFLLLDEPDNHLDIESKSVLAHAIKHYLGGILLVSHDTNFMIDCKITKAIYLEK